MLVLGKAASESLNGSPKVTNILVASDKVDTLKKKLSIDGSKSATVLTSNYDVFKRNKDGKRFRFIDFDSTDGSRGSRYLNYMIKSSLAEETIQFASPYYNFIYYYTIANSRVKDSVSWYNCYKKCEEFLKEFPLDSIRTRKLKMLTKQFSLALNTVGLIDLKNCARVKFDYVGKDDLLDVLTQGDPLSPITRVTIGNDTDLTILPALFAALSYENKLKAIQDLLTLYVFNESFLVYDLCGMPYPDDSKWDEFYLEIIMNIVTYKKPLNGNIIVRDFVRDNIHCIVKGLRKKDLKRLIEAYDYGLFTQ